LHLPDGSADNRPGANNVFMAAAGDRWL